MINMLEMGRVYETEAIPQIAAVGLRDFASSMPVRAGHPRLW
jgi:hypothetical protein